MKYMDGLPIAEKLLEGETTSKLFPRVFFFFFACVGSDTWHQ